MGVFDTLIRDNAQLCCIFREPTKARKWYITLGKHLIIFEVDGVCVLRTSCGCLGRTSRRGGLPPHERRWNELQQDQASTC